MSPLILDDAGRLMAEEWMVWNHVLDPGSGQNGTGMGPDSWTPWYMTGRENGAVAKRVRRLVEKRGSVLHEWGV